MDFDIAAVLDVGPGWNKVRLTNGEIVTLDGSYNWRSNNPGNLEYTPFTRNHGALASGAVPPDRERGFAIFPDLKTGNQARIELQFQNPKYRDLTIAGAMELYAPRHENDTDGYARQLAEAVGVPVTTKMSDLTPEQRERYVTAQDQIEGMVPGDVYDEQGIRLPPADLNPPAPSLRPNAPLVPGSYPGPNTRRLPPLGPSAGPPAQLVRPDVPATRNLLPPIQPSTLGTRPTSPSASDRARGQQPAPAMNQQRPTSPVRSAGDSLALNPVQGGRPVAPAMDAAYDREQGVMAMRPSPVGEMPTLAATRAAFGLDPLVTSPAVRAPAQRPRVTVSTPYTTPQSSIERGAPRPAAPLISAQPSNLDTARAEQRLMRTLRPATTAAPIGRPAAPAIATPGTGIVQSPSLAPVEAVRPSLGPTAPAITARPSPPTVAPLPVVQGAQPVAPTPTPRLDRPGFFGKPQVFGRDIQLPGALGVIQDITKRMANASGPFNNGADNLIYNTMRGGDFNTPGAATKEAGGFRYAPKQGGGYINVGRVNPAQTGAALYDSLNRRNENADDAANRVNGRGGSGGGARSLMS